jgi:hypothetical protein
MLFSQLGCDLPLRLVRIFLERRHRALHLALLGGHRVQLSANRKLRALLLIAQASDILGLVHGHIIALG